MRERGHSRGKSTSKARGHLFGEEAMGSFNMKIAAAELAGASAQQLLPTQQVQGGCGTCAGHRAELL